MTSSNGNIFRVTGHLCGEFTGHRWIPLTKASDAELSCFFDLRLNKRLSKQSWGWWFEMPSRSLWHHCSATDPRMGIQNEFHSFPYFPWFFHMVVKTLVMYWILHSYLTEGDTRQIWKWFKEPKWYFCKIEISFREFTNGVLVTQSSLKHLFSIQKHVPIVMERSISNQINWNETYSCLYSFPVILSKYDDILLMICRNPILNEPFSFWTK